MPRVPRPWLRNHSEIHLDHRADPCVHDVNTANLAALSKDCPVSGPELHTFIGEQGDMFHICKAPNTEDVVWHVRGMFYACQSHHRCAITGPELHLDSSAAKSFQQTSRCNAINLRWVSVEFNKVVPVLGNVCC